jgi:hypothetical protein
MFHVGNRPQPTILARFPQVDVTPSSPAHARSWNRHSRTESVRLDFSARHRGST